MNNLAALTARANREIDARKNGRKPAPQTVTVSAQALERMWAADTAREVATAGRR